MRINLKHYQVAGELGKRGSPSHLLFLKSIPARSPSRGPSPSPLLVPSTILAYVPIVPGSARTSVFANRVVRTARTSSRDEPSPLSADEPPPAI